MKRILIVEDELLSGLALEAFLKDEGFTVAHVQSGRDALTRASAFLPDVLISDWKLKDEIDGIEVARELTKLNPRLVTIFCSGMRIEDMRLKSGAIAVHCFLEKPCGLERVLAAVKTGTS